MSLISGTEIKSRLRVDGRGELTIRNSTSYDAVVNLVEPDTRKLDRSFYVRSNETFVEKNIAPGYYEIYFTTGTNWDAKRLAFLEDASYGRLERGVQYSERQDPVSGQIKYCGFEVTLQATEGGDVASLPVDEHVFREMMDQPADSAQLVQHPANGRPTNSN